MKSRLALAVILALGMLFTVSGAFAAADGFDNDNDAAHSQYHDNSANDGQNFDSVGSGGGNGDGNVDSGAQDGTGGGNLAATGFAAIPLLIIGVALLGGGAVLSVKRKE